MGVEEIVFSMAALVEARPLQQPVRPVVVPPQDDEADPDADPLGYAEGQSFMIEYTDAKGQQSRRRITVYDIVAGRSGIPCLRARCHERSATRQFRVDRIQCCIDFDGEVHDDVPVFIAETFGMPIWAAQRRATDESEDRWTSIIAIIRNEAVLLSALSRVDGTVKASEVDEAVAHLASIVERRNVFLTSNEVASIKTYIKRLRPSSEAISRALASMGSSSPDQVTRFLIAAKNVIEADGFRHPTEINLLDDIAHELIGVALT